MEGPGHESGSGLRAGGPAAAVGPRKEGERVVGPKGAERGSGGPRMAAPSPPPTSSPGGLAAPEGPSGCTVSQRDSRGATAFPPVPQNTTQHSVGKCKPGKERNTLLEIKERVIYTETRSRRLRRESRQRPGRAGTKPPFPGLVSRRPKGRRTGTEEGEWVRKPSRSGCLSRPRGAASAFAGRSPLAGSRGQYFGALRAADRPRGHRSPESHRHSHVRACGQGVASHSSQKPPVPEDT